MFDDEEFAADLPADDHRPVAVYILAGLAALGLGTVVYGLYALVDLVV